MRLEVFDDLHGSWVESIYHPDDWEDIECTATDAYRMIDETGLVVREFYPHGWAYREDAGLCEDDGRLE